MFRAINLKDKTSSGIAGRAFANEKAMLDPTQCDKTMRLVKRVNKSGIFRVIETIKSSID